MAEIKIRQLLAELAGDGKGDGGMSVTLNQEQCNMLSAYVYALEEDWGEMYSGLGLIRLQHDKGCLIHSKVKKCSCWNNIANRILSNLLVTNEEH